LEPARAEGSDVATLTGVPCAILQFLNLAARLLTCINLVCKLDAALTAIFRAESIAKLTHLGFTAMESE
jgi:hypothetical protein